MDRLSLTERLSKVREAKVNVPDTTRSVTVVDWRLADPFTVRDCSELGPTTVREEIEAVAKSADRLTDKLSMDREEAVQDPCTVRLPLTSASPPTTRDATSAEVTMKGPSR